MPLDSRSAPTQADALADRLAAAFSHPFAVAGRHLRLGASIGRAAFPSDADGAESLLRAADAAMFAAKRAGYEIAPSPLRRGG